MKVLNVFGIILAWLLSIALVALLIAAPVTFSALSLLDAENITNAVTDSLGTPSAAAPKGEKDYGLNKLSNGLPLEISSADQILGALEDVLGSKLDADAFNKIVDSDAAKELVEIYVADVVDVLTGEDGAPRLDEEKLIQVVEDNIDEIAEIIQDIAPEFSESSIAEVKNDIKKAIRENAGKILQSILTPQQIRDAIFDSGVGAEMIADLLAQKDTYLSAIFGAIVLLSLLIFLLRLPGFRGLRWLSTDLFTATGLNAVICVILFVSSSAIIGLADGIKLLEAINVNAMIRSILTVFTRGVMLRTVVMLVSAIVLMVLYVILKTIRHKKPAKQAAPASPSPAAPVRQAVPQPEPTYAPAAPAEAPAAPVQAPPAVPEETPTVSAPVAEEPQPAAPVAPYTAPPVIEAPDLLSSQEDDILPEDWEFEVDISPAEAPQPEPETKPETAPEAEPEPVAEAESEPVAEAEPEPDSKPEDDTLF